MTTQTLDEAELAAALFRIADEIGQGDMRRCAEFMNLLLARLGEQAIGDALRAAESVFRPQPYSCANIIALIQHLLTGVRRPGESHHETDDLLSSLLRRLESSVLNRETV